MVYILIVGKTTGRRFQVGCHFKAYPQKFRNVACKNLSINLSQVQLALVHSHIPNPERLAKLSCQQRTEFASGNTFEGLPMIDGDSRTSRPFMSQLRNVTFTAGQTKSPKDDPGVGMEKLQGHPRRKESGLTFHEYWLFNSHPYVMVYEINPI